MLDIKQRKAQLRQQLRTSRRALPEPEARRAAASAAERLLRSPLWRNSRRVGLYLPNDGEMDTALIAAEAGHRALFLPKITDRTLLFAAWQPGDALHPNRFGIGEPSGPTVQASSLDLLILPLVGFSDAGRRLGMGGGYYDRCLGVAGREERPWLLGLGYECQRCDELPGESWDMDLDAVLTEAALQPCSDQFRAFLQTPDTA